MESKLCYIGAHAKLTPGQSAQTDSESTKISSDSVRLCTSPHGLAQNMWGRVKTLSIPASFKKWCSKITDQHHTAMWAQAWEPSAKKQYHCWPSLWKEGMSEIVHLCLILIILTSSSSKCPWYSCTVESKVARGSQRGKSTGIRCGMTSMGDRDILSTISEEGHQVPTHGTTQFWCCSSAIIPVLCKTLDWNALILQLRSYLVQYSQSSFKCSCCPCNDHSQH